MSKLFTDKRPAYVKIAPDTRQSNMDVPIPWVGVEVIGRKFLWFRNAHPDKKDGENYTKASTVLTGLTHDGVEFILGKPVNIRGSSVEKGIKMSRKRGAIGVYVAEKDRPGLGFRLGMKPRMLSTSPTQLNTEDFERQIKDLEKKLQAWIKR